ncbi:MAG: carbohydrate porin, partial [Acetobacteraceae bacterium]|nr:carbohydrate porin [Acetobacteraceae bacterium]
MRTEAGRPRFLALAGLIVGIFSANAYGQPAPDQPVQEPTPPAGPVERAAPGGETGAPTVPAPEVGGLWQRDRLLGDMLGLRTVLGGYGVSLGLQETSEVWGNPTGGVSQGMAYDGLTEMSLGLDLEKAIGLKGGLFNVSAFQIHERGLTLTRIDNLNVISSIEARPTARLFELWYQQSFFDGKLDIRVGQLAADQEFVLSTYGSLFINSSFGWPTLNAADLPAGGPAYPFATPGVRLRARPVEPLLVQAGIYNGNPAGPGVGDPQERNSSGTIFILTGVFVIGEIQYAINQGEGATGLPGTYKLGGWYNSNPFPDQRFDFLGISLASPDSVGIPRSLRNNYSIYAVADQLVYRPAGAKEGGIGLFARVMGAPGDRNLINFFADGGVTYRGVIP